MSNTKYFLPSFLITLFFDQFSKFLATMAGVPINYNTGISFSFLTNTNPKLLTFILIIFVYFLFVFFKNNWQRNDLAAGLFFGGAVANIFDRVLFESVRDWLQIPFTQIQNNIADWAIFFGLFIIIFQSIFEKSKKN